MRQFLESHKGGYTPFSFEVTRHLKEENEIVVKVKDEADTAQPRGKQYWTDSPDAVGIPLHKDASGSNWGYGKTESDENDVIRRYQDVTCAIMKIPGCYGFCYTQLTDVYQEVNGLMDMKHKTKLHPAKIRQIHEMI